METEALELRGAHGWFSMHARLLEPGVSRLGTVQYIQYAAGGSGFQGTGSSFVEDEALHQFCRGIYALAENPTNSVEIRGHEERGLVLSISPGHSSDLVAVRGSITMTNVVWPAENSPRYIWGMQFGFWCEAEQLYALRKVSWVRKYAG